jgi:LacI family transcriptional regulator
LPSHSQHHEAILVAVQARYGYGRQILEGVGDYCRRQSHWRVYFDDERRVDPERIADQEIRGVITEVRNEYIRNCILEAGVPAVNISGGMDVPQIPTIYCDPWRIGREGAEHLLARGHRRLAYVGGSGHLASRRRGEGFAEAVKRAGRRARLIWVRGACFAEELQSWLAEADGPSAVMTSDDFLAQAILHGALEEGIRIPHDLSIVGVNNDPIACSLAPVPLSSLELPTRTIGTRAAALLAQQMAGRKVPMRTYLDPVGMITRQSSDSMAVDDDRLVAACRFVIENVDRPIGVDDVAEAAAIARRTLERKFSAAFGWTIGDELIRARLERAKRLLAETDDTMQHVAEASGFGTSKYLATVFHKRTGLTPSAYRKRFR